MAGSVEQTQREEQRLCLLRILYEAGQALRGRLCRSMMDDLGYPTTWDGFTRVIEYLRAEHLLHCFPEDLRESQNDVAESRFVQLLMNASFDCREATTFKLKIAPRGKRLIEGTEEVKGV